MKVRLSSPHVYLIMYLFCNFRANWWSVHYITGSWPFCKRSVVISVRKYVFGLIRNAHISGSTGLNRFLSGPHLKNVMCCSMWTIALIYKVDVFDLFFLRGSSSLHGGAIRASTQIEMRLKVETLFLLTRKKSPGKKNLRKKGEIYIESYL